MKYANNISSITITTLIILFIYTGVNKYIDNQTFEVVMNDSPLLRPFTSFISVFLPGFEIAIAILLMLPKTQVFGLWASAILLSAFIIYLVYMIIFTPNLPCSCGGIISSLSWSGHIVLNSVCLSGSIFTIWYKRKTVQPAT